MAIRIHLYLYLLDVNELLSGLSQGVIPGLIVLAYMIIIKWLEDRKETKEEAINKSIDNRVNILTDNVTELVDSMREVSVQLHNVTSNIVERDREKCKISIELAFIAFVKELCDFGFLTIYNNHLDENRSIIESNVESIINSEYYKVYSILSLYEINGRKVSQNLKPEWKEELSDGLINVIYNDKLNDIEKVNMLRTKLNIKGKDYSNYVYNNTFNA